MYSIGTRWQNKEGDTIEIVACPNPRIRGFVLGPHGLTFGISPKTLDERFTPCGTGDWHTTAITPGLTVESPVHGTLLVKGVSPEGALMWRPSTEEQMVFPAKDFPTNLRRVEDPGWGTGAYPELAAGQRWRSLDQGVIEVVQVLSCCISVLVVSGTYQRPGVVTTSAFDTMAYLGGTGDWHTTAILNKDSWVDSTGLQMTIESESQGLLVLRAPGGWACLLPPSELRKNFRRILPRVEESEESSV